MNLYRNIRPEAIQTAQRNADKAERQGYTVIPSELVPDQYRVYHPKGGFYVCQPTIATMGKCDCKQWEQEAYCKHLELCKRYEDAEWEASVIAREEEQEVTEEARFFMMECQREVLAELEGAWF